MIISGGDAASYKSAVRALFEEQVATPQEPTKWWVTHYEVRFMKRDWQCEDPKQQLVWAAASSETLRVLEGKWKIVIIVQRGRRCDFPNWSAVSRE